MNGIIVSLDVESRQTLDEIVAKTHDIPEVLGFKLGVLSSLSIGLAEAVRLICGRTDKQIIYDHQKAGNDIPDITRRLVKLAGEAGSLPGAISQVIHAEQRRKIELPAVHAASKQSPRSQAIAAVGDTVPNRRHQPRVRKAPALHIQIVSSAAVVRPICRRVAAHWAADIRVIERLIQN